MLNTSTLKKSALFYLFFFCLFAEARAIDFSAGGKRWMSGFASVFFLPEVDKQQRQNTRWKGYFPAGRIQGGISAPKVRSEL